MNNYVATQQTWHSLFFIDFLTHLDSALILQLTIIVFGLKNDSFLIFLITNDLWCFGINPST